jgi:aminoglycoside phosphotransferase (APT) family kinase protein
MQKMYHREIADIIQKEFDCDPGRIARMSNGICNEVYLVEAGEQEVIVRLKAEARYMFGSHNHIPLFRSKGIRVPEILAEDYSKSFVAISYQILSKIEGQDLGDVIHTLTDEQLRAIAREISQVFLQLKDVPNNGKFGVLWGDTSDLVNSWPAEVARMTGVVLGWGAKTRVLDTDLKRILQWINTEYRDYFERVKSVTYFGDICSKNVMVHKGCFVGLVDLDSLAQGDPLEAIGRIKASWYGTNYGRVYTSAVMDEQELTRGQRQIVTMYALLNRTYWTLENGIQFNQNTNTQVDGAREKRDKAIVRALYNELTAHSQ